MARLVELYLREQTSVLTAQTVGDKRRRLEAFMEWFGGDRDCREVTRKVAGNYLTEVIQQRVQTGAGGLESPLTAKTKGKEVSDLRTFFQWLTDRGRLDENPFQRMARSIKDSTRAQPLSRRAWKAEELTHILANVDYHDPVWPMTAIAAYSGMRREEVVELKVSDVVDSGFKIERGKTKSANRTVPIHPVLEPLVAQLVATSTDGFLISGLLRGGPDGKRGWYVGKRFGRLIRQLGLTDPQLDFHALRGTVVSQLEEAGVPLATIQLIVGHNRQGVTYKYYSPAGVSDKARRVALEKVGYGTLDEVVSRLGADVRVRVSAPARKAPSAS